MTFREMYKMETKLLRDIEREKKFTWHKLRKIMELEALIDAKNVQ